MAARPFFGGPCPGPVLRRAWLMWTGGDLVIADGTLTVAGTGSGVLTVTVDGTASGEATGTDRVTLNVIGPPGTYTATFTAALRLDRVTWNTTGGDCTA
ncbi:MAG TPA: hypothetical protein VIJ00_00565 [Nakamurella sp.]